MSSSNPAVQNLELLKYPRTPHLQGSRLQAGDDGSDQVPYSALAGRYLVVEEKLDGGNAGLSFDAGGELLLQSRGHYLVGGGRERQFNLFKHWAVAHAPRLLEVLDDRYLMFGEWLHKKHTVYYDRLPHYFCEFDVWDRARQLFLTTAARAHLLGSVPVLPVPVLYAGIAPRRLEDLLELLRPSLARSAQWRTSFETTLTREGLDLGRAWAQTDRSELAEGLYLKVEDEHQTLQRYKWVRADFVQAILDSAQHHAEQPFVPNGLAEGVDIFAPELHVRWPEVNA